MMPLKVSWSGQTFALARCSDSLEKKTRRRRSKEERKTMVESFIKKYQNSNSGNFPSLNLTHKEVGGSFYTVREIVREIIQENKVLAPGNPTSKALNFDSCSEDVASAFFYIDPHAIDQECAENYSLSSEHQIINKEGYDVDNSETVDSLSSHSNDRLSFHIESSDHLDQSFSGAKHLDENLLDAENEGSDTKKLSGMTCNNSEAHQFLYSEVQNLSSVASEDFSNHKMEQQHAHLCESVPLSYSSREEGVNEYDTGNQKKSVTGTTNSTWESTNVAGITGNDKLSETKVSLNSVNGNISSPLFEYSSSVAKEVNLLASKSYSSDGGSIEPGHSTRSAEVSGTHILSSDIKTTSPSVDKNLISKRTELARDLPSSPINGASPARETRSTLEISETAEPELQHPLQSGYSENIAPDTESVSPSDIKEPGVSLTAELKDIASSSGHSVDAPAGPTSISFREAGEEAEKEKNPVWDAVKAFVAAVVKFWTE